MMTIQSILCITHYAGMYGANQSLFAIIRIRAALGAKDLVLVPSKGVFVDRLEQIGVNYLLIEVPLSYHIPSNRANPLLRALRWGMNRFEILHKRYVLKSTVHKLSRVQYQFSLVHTNTALTELGWAISRVLQIPHVWHIREFGDLDYHFKYDFNNKIRLSRLNSADSIICVGEKLVDHYELRGCSKLTVIRNGVLPLSVANSLDWKRDRSELSLLIIGYLSETKGQHLAIEAFAEIQRAYPHAKLNIVGDGDATYTQYLHSLVEQKDLKNVCFLGLQHDVSPYYLSAKYTLMCSANEAMGRVTPEAMLHGSVVIGLNNAGTAEMISDGENGILFNGEPEELASEVLKLEADMQKYERIKLCARSQAMELYVEENYAERVFEQYQKVCDEEVR